MVTQKWKTMPSEEKKHFQTMAERKFNSAYAASNTQQNQMKKTGIMMQNGL
jgi:hypothetical protein